MESKRAPRIPDVNIFKNSTVQMVLGTVFAAGLIGFVGYTGRPVTIPAQVNHLTWHLSQSVEEQQTLEWSGWERNKPSGFHETFRTSKYAGQEKVKDGTTTEHYTYKDCKSTNTGKGAAAKTCTTVSGTREVPKYKNVDKYEPWVEGTYQRWVPIDSANADGFDDEPRQINVYVQPGTLPRRLGPVSETCSGVFRAGTNGAGFREGEARNIDIPCGQYDRLEPGDSVRLTRGWFGSDYTATPVDHQ
jgi:hypothetical protein